MATRTHTRVLYAILLSSSCLAGTAVAGEARGTRKTARCDSDGLARAVYNVGFKSDASSPAHAAQVYLADPQSDIHILQAARNLKLQSVHSTATSSHVRFTQSYSNIPVYDADVVVSLDALNEVSLVVSNFKNSIRPIATMPLLSTNDAIHKASEAICQQGPTVGKERTTLMIYRAGGVGDLLVYRVFIVTQKPAGAWEVLVDALDGTIRRMENRAVSHHNGDRVQGQGHVFLSDPLSASHHRYNDPGFTDSNDADSDSLTACRTLVTLDSLTFEQGVYALEGPYCSITDIETPADPHTYTASSPSAFNYTRSQQGFEAVNAYYHISKSYKRVLELGFTSTTLTQLRVDPHGLDGEDNSHFVPEENYIAFGEGGVDDAEDAEVIWHEYGHAIQYNVIPTWGGNYESAALGEGFADYWAASYTRSLHQWNPSEQQYNYVFKWNGHNPYSLGRFLNYGGTYPFNRHDMYLDGQVWSSALMSIWNQLGRDITDKLVLQSFMYLGSNATGTDAAQAIIQADRDLFDGTHVQTLVYWLGTVKHFISPEDFVPVIVHTPLQDSENSHGPFTVRAEITSTRGIASAFIVWSTSGRFADSLALIPTESVNEYSASLPAANAAQLYRYYLIVRDSAGIAATSPRNAPGGYHAFQAGTDSVAPTITHDPLTKASIYSWPPTMSARVVDALMVDSVWVVFQLPGQLVERRFPLDTTPSGDYAARFPVAATAVQPGDIITYRILATDGSSRHNVSISKNYGFSVTASKNPVLIVDDISSRNSPIGFVVRELELAGLSISYSTFAALDTRALKTFSAVVLLGGTNPAPFEDAAKRAAVVAYVRGGGKVLVEGGRVAGHYSPNNKGEEIDAEFRQVVLHHASVVADEPAETITLSMSRHPMVTLRHTLPGTIGFVGATSAADREAVMIPTDERGTTTLGSWSVTRSIPGIIICENSGSPAEPGTILFTFSLASVADSLVAAHLVENAIVYLSASEQTVAGTPANPAQQPVEFALEQNYPNPFNPSTSIPFTLPEQGRVSIRIHNLLGQVIATLVDGERFAGHHHVTWQGANDRGSSVASGIYLCRVEFHTATRQETITQQRKMVLLR